ncbi:isoprenylcysteine carboxylmethyltransferase family protein [Nonomuraea sp. B10E15]|uniref:methyltransferase family protein n=1 Tax=Nonomuraea sp. B10E15 TaxID=3153560 RepID=UPI00325F572C
MFFAVGPGLFVVLIPWWISRWQLREPFPAWAMVPLRGVGVVLLSAGLVILAQAFVRFVVEGFGTPIPAAPPDRLVVGGLYRYVRNPMYVGLFAAVVGQAMAFGNGWLLVYAAGMAIPVVLFVRFYEERKLRRRFGADYEKYCATVPGWWPRLRPYRP